MTTQNVKELTITLPLRKYISQLLNGFECQNIDIETAQLIVLLDTNELFCHVQFDSVVYDRMKYDHQIYNLDSPVLWDIVHWRKASTRYKMLKAKDDEERIKGWIEKENIYRIAKALSKMTGVDVETLKLPARKMLKSNNPSSYEVLNVKLATTLEEIK